MAAEKKPFLPSQYKVYKWFAGSTSFHGFKRTVDGRNKVRKALWGAAIITAFTAVVLLVSFRVAKYFQYDTITELRSEASETVEFPAITICNQFVAKQSATDPNTEFKFWLPQTTPAPNMESVTTAPPFDTDKYVAKYQRTAEDDVIQNFEYMETRGWQLLDFNDTEDRNLVTLLECKFTRRNCTSKWFKRVLSSMGNCYTFNYLGMELDDAEVTLPLSQRQDGPIYGLRLALNIEEYEYLTHNNIYGAKIYIHDPREEPDFMLPGIHIPVGTYANIPFTKTEIYSLHEPWGRCDPSKKLQIAPHLPYSRNACIVECKALHVVDECSCKPYYAKDKLDNLKDCNTTEWYECVKPKQAEVEADFEAYCNCPISCSETKYESGASYVLLSSDDETTKYANIKFYSDAEGSTLYNNYMEYNLRSPWNYGGFYQNTVIELNIHYSSLAVTKVIEKKALDEIKLLSEIGGQLGLFVGVSMLTICEVIEYIIVLSCGRRLLNQ